jgi:two-component system chemotaxis response regulator CheY
MSLREVDFSDMTFLIIDDQEHVRALVGQLLLRLGVGRVLEEADGAAALLSLQTANPDFILCDVRMEPMDGLEFLKQVRSGNGGIRDPHVPIVFLSADSGQGTVMAAIESHIDGYLIKPVSLSDLKSKIVAILDRRRAQSRK